MVRLVKDMVSARTGTIFPSGQLYVAERDAISIIIRHPDDPELTIRVADRNILSGVHDTEPEPEKPKKIVLPTTTVVQMSLF